MVTCTSMTNKYYLVILQQLELANAAAVSTINKMNLNKSYFQLRKDVAS